MKRTLFGLSALIFTFSTLPLVAQNAPAPIFTLQDERLGSPISVKQTGITLQNLLRQISPPSVILRAGRSCAEQKIQINLKNRSRRVVMEALAELIKGRWQTEGKDGYLLVQDEDAVLKRNLWWRYYEENQQESKNVLVQALLRRMHSRPVPAGFLEGLNETPPDIQRNNDKRLGFFNLLPMELQKSIAETILDSAFVFGGNMIYSGQEAVIGRPFSELPEKLQKYIQDELAHDKAEHEQTRQDADKPDTRVADSTVLFRNEGVNIRVSLVFADGQQYGTAIMISAAPPKNVSFLGLDHRGVPAEVKRLGIKAPSSLKRLADFQKTTVWNNPLTSPDSYQFPPLDRTEVLNWLAEKSKIEFIADDYNTDSRPMTQEDREQTPSAPPAKELNLLSTTHDVSWKQRTDQLYLVRNNRWYRDDFLQAPDNLIQEGIEAASPLSKMKNGVLPDLAAVKSLTEWQAKAWTTLSYWQIAYGICPAIQVSKTGQREFPLFAVGEQILKHPKLLQFYASLSSPQKELLWKEGLRLSNLSDAQRLAVAPLLAQLPSPSPNAPPRLVLGTEQLVFSRSKPGSLNLTYELKLKFAP